MTIVLPSFTHQCCFAVKASSAESLDRKQLPGLEVYQDSDDGAMYSVAF